MWAQRLKPRSFVRFIHTVHRRKKTVLHMVLPIHGEWNGTVQKKRSTGNRIEPYHGISDTRYVKSAPNHREKYFRLLKNPSNRTAGFPISEKERRHVCADG